MLNFWKPVPPSPPSLEQQHAQAKALLQRVVPRLSPGHFHNEKIGLWGFLSTSGKTNPIGFYMTASGSRIIAMASSDLNLDPDWASRAILWELLVANDQLAHGSYRLVKKDQTYSVVLGVTLEAQHWSDAALLALVRTLIAQFEALLVRLYAKNLSDNSPLPVDVE
ncbi:MAG TPA: hypothetical protein VM165_15585 [Planctomycetaceae bacterium]|nr:hypothetical protein [Planctomycetaceae bacterium]